MKTNAARLLDRLQIAYELRSYPVGEEHLSAERVAALIGLSAAEVFKTLVVRGDRSGVLLAVIPGDRALDLKALAKLSKNRSCVTVALKEVQPLTGYVRGGVTALACKRPYQTYVHDTVTEHARISVSAGARGLQLILTPADYLRATAATVGPLAGGLGTHAV